LERELQRGVRHAAALRRRTAYESGANTLVFRDESGAMMLDIASASFTPEIDTMAVVFNYEDSYVFGQELTLKETAAASLVFTNGDRGPRKDLPEKRPLMAAFQIVRYDPAAPDELTGSLETAVDAISLPMARGADGLHRSDPVVPVYNGVPAGEVPAVPGFARQVLFVDPGTPDSKEWTDSGIGLWLFGSNKARNGASRGPLMVVGTWFDQDGTARTSLRRLNRWGDGLAKSFQYKDFTSLEAPSLNELLAELPKHEILVHIGHARLPSFCTPAENFVGLPLRSTGAGTEYLTPNLLPDPAEDPELALQYRLAIVLACYSGASAQPAVQEMVRKMNATDANGEPGAYVGWQCKGEEPTSAEYAEKLTMGWEEDMSPDPIPLLHPPIRPFWTPSALESESMHILGSSASGRFHRDEWIMYLNANPADHRQRALQAPRCLFPYCPQ
jgi:hypothetical protein